MFFVQPQISKPTVSIIIDRFYIALFSAIGYWPHTKTKTSDTDTQSSEAV